MVEKIPIKNIKFRSLHMLSKHGKEKHIAWNLESYSINRCVTFYVMFFEGGCGGDLNSCPDTTRLTNEIRNYICEFDFCIYNSEIFKILFTIISIISFVLNNR